MNMYNSKGSSVNNEKMKQLIGDAKNTPVMFNKGSVTTITIGGKAFDIFSPQTLEAIMRQLQESSTAVQNLRDSLSKTNLVLKQVQNENAALKQEIASIRREIKNSFGDRNGY